jgi:ABC-type multidrug transport system fused ATPase/permease subunit
MLVIAHRFSTVRAADQVVVLDRGRVVAAGNHEELLSTNDYYRGLAAGWLDSPRREESRRDQASRAPAP